MGPIWLRRAVAVITASSALLGFAADAPLKIAPVAFNERVLANGLQVIAVPSSASPTVSVQVWYHVGAKDDPAGRSGFAHLFEHLMFKSTAHLKAEQFDRLTEDVGGANNAFTGNDVTGYTDLVPSNHLEVLLWAEAERMSNLNVVQANFVSERAVVEEEYRERVLATPYGRFGNAIAPAAYQVHPYKRPSIGSIADLDAATLADVVAFHARYYRPDNATLVVAGDFDPKQLQAWIDQYFGPVKKPDATLPRVSVVEPRWTADRRAELHGPQVPLPAVAVVWQGPPVADADAAALRVAAALLSAGESGRLNQSLVYRQQVASQAGFDADLRMGPGLLTGYAIVAGGHTPEQAGKALLAEVMKLADKPVPAAELAKVKTQMLTSALVERQTPNGEASALAEAAVLYGHAGEVNAKLEQLRRVSAADVQRVMRRYVAQGHKVTVTYSQGSDK